jgi:transposase-like protein
MNRATTPYAGYRYLAEIVSHAVWLYFRCTLSFRALGSSAAFCILRSVGETNKLNGINLFDTPRLVFEGR